MKLRFGSRREANRRQRHPAQGPNVLQALLQNGADVDVTDHAGETAMFRLVRSIDPGAGALAVELVKIMLDAGADPTPGTTQERPRSVSRHPSRHGSKN
jgi:hypothetical protein